MPVISGGGAGGNTTAQVVASGKVVPVADATGVTVNGGTLVFPSGADNVFATAITGDAFPRVTFGADPINGGIAFGDGTVAPGRVLFFVGPGGTAELNTGGGLILSGGPLLLNEDATAAGDAPRLQQLSPVFTITAGALATVQLVSATGAQILPGRDVETVTPCTFNPGAATTATVTVALSPDNVTYSTLGIETEPAGVAFDGTIHLVKVRVPAGWYLKLTVNAQAVLGLTTYY